MTAAPREDPGPAGSVFLVERYLPPTSAGGLPDSVARTARLCDQSAGPASPEQSLLAPVQYLSSTYMPTDDTCFCLFRASTAEAVQALNDAAGFALDRITAAVQLFPAVHERPGPSSPPEEQP